MHQINSEAVNWQVFGASMIGGTHLHQKQPKQDAMHWLPVSGRGHRVVTAVADGHGASTYFRSARGANYAVAAMTEVLKEFMGSQGKEPDLEVIEHWAHQELPKLIVGRWREEVEADLQAAPYSPQELALMDTATPPTPNDDNCTWLVPYGSTCLGLALTEHFIVALQLGDGDMGMVYPNGEAKWLIPDGPRQADHTTFSLCRPEAWKGFRARVHPLGDFPPALLSLTTDGFRGAFGNEMDFFRNGQRFLNIVRRRGLIRTAENLHNWMENHAQREDGDDITAAFVYLLGDYHSHKHLRSRHTR